MVPVRSRSFAVDKLNAQIDGRFGLTEFFCGLGPRKSTHGASVTIQGMVG